MDRQLKRVHSGRLERWVGGPMLEKMSRSMRGWYGPPIHLIDIPGSVRICGDGDFIGEFDRGYFVSAIDAMRDARARLNAWARLTSRPSYRIGAGFATVADYLSRRQQGHVQRLTFSKAGSTTALFNPQSDWGIGNVPAAGAAGSAAPGGRAPDNTTTGALPLRNPDSGTMHLTGFDGGIQYGSSVVEAVLLYDRIFDVAKTMASTATEAVTGVPTRYTSTTATDADYAGGNFVFPEVHATLATTAHNWATCRYQNQDGTTGQNIQTVAGRTDAPQLQRIDMLNSGAWFMPLSTGDTGIRALTQMQCSASVSGTLTFAMGHPIGFLVFGHMGSGDIWGNHEFITKRQQAPRILNGACLAAIRIFSGLVSSIQHRLEIEVTTAAA